MNQDQFLLKWNNHQNNLVEVFSFLRTQDAFVDVTLACDGKSFPAHKVVLSACSPYFQSLFQSNPCKHPIVFLKDVKSHDMEALIEFIYKGEVSVSQAELASLISTAENLKIKGLAEPEKPSEKHSNCSSNKRLATSPPRLGGGVVPPSQLQPALNSSPGLHASPLYLQSTPSAKRKRIEAPPHYSSYAPSYLTAATGGGGGNGSVLLRDKDGVDGGMGKGTAVVCNNTGSVVVDMNSSAAHRLVESVVNGSGGNGCGGVATGGPSQVVLVQGPVPGEEHLTAAGDLSYNSSSHHGLSTSDAVLYSVAGTAIYVGRVGPGPGDDGGPPREVMYTSGGEHYASSDEGGTITATAPPCGSDEKHEVKLSIKLEPNSNLNSDPCPWEPASNSSNHSYDDAVPTPSTTTTATPPTPSSCITSPHHPSPLHHLQHNHLHTPTSAPSPNPPSMQLANNNGSVDGGGVCVPSSSSTDQPQHLTIPGLTLHPPDDLGDSGSLHDSASARAGGGGGVCEEAGRCLDITHFTAMPQQQHNTKHNSTATVVVTSGGVNSNSCISTAAGSTTTTIINNGNSSNITNNGTGGGGGISATAGGDAPGTILEVQGCFIKSEVGAITSGTMRRLLECEHCHKFFTSRFNLQRHQLIHTGAKPYECPLCQQRFNQSGHVKTHLRTRHPNHDQILQDPIHQHQHQEHRSTSSSNDHLALQQHSNNSTDHSQEDPDEDHISIQQQTAQQQQQQQHNDHVATHTIQHSDHVTSHSSVQRSEHL